MFDFIGIFFQKIGVSVGASLIALGSFFVGEPVEEPIVVTTENQMELESEIRSPKEPQLESDSPQQVQTKTQVSIPTTQTSSAKATLQIENVQNIIEENQATITWTTTLPAESRLIMDNGEGRVFESENGLNTNHKVRVSGLEESVEYDYKITATTQDKSKNDDHFDIFYANKKYTALFGVSENDCRIIIVKDTAGHIAPNKTITLRPIRVLIGGTNVQRPNVSVTTNLKGEVKYCETANIFRIIGEELDITISAS